MNWLITGGCGFIGSTLVGKLLEDPKNRIRILDNLSVGSREDLKKIGSVVEMPPDKPSEKPTSLEKGTVELLIGDVLDPSMVMRAASGMDVIVHLAANTGVGPSVIDPKKDCETNVLGTLNMLEAARSEHVNRFVFASSGAPVGVCEPPIHEEMAPHPASPYGASKLAGEGYCSAYFWSYGLQTVVLRFSNVYGPGSGHKQSVVAKFIRQAMSGKTLEIYGDGGQSRDFIYLEDLVRAILSAGTQQNVGGELFQIATSRETLLSELVDTLVKVLREVGVSNVDVKHAEKRPGDVLRNYSNTEKAERILGWKAEVSLEEGLRRTISWFKQRNSV